MATHPTEYLSDVRASLTLIAEALAALQAVCDDAMQRGEWTCPEWQDAATHVRALAMQMQTLAASVPTLHTTIH